MNCKSGTYIVESKYSLSNVSEVSHEVQTGQIWHSPLDPRLRLYALSAEAWQDRHGGNGIADPARH